MSSLDLVARLEAYAENGPVSITDALPFERLEDDERLIVVFVRMGGEAASWGIAVGHPGEEPTILTVPEPRDRDLVASMAAQFCEHLDAHMPHPRYVGGDVEEAVRCRRQLWLPGPSHLEMLHLIALAYTRARRGDEDRVAVLNRLGRTCGYLFRESSRPGQMRVLEATSVLRGLFAYPAEDGRQAHLDFLLAWHASAADRRRAAREAEQHTVGITLDPDFENDALAPLVEQYGQAERGSATRDELSARIDEVLGEELRRRFRLTESAIRLVDVDPRPENTALPELRKLARDELRTQYFDRELPFWQGESTWFIDAETDHYPPAAASRFFSQEQSAEAAAAALPHGDDRLVQRLLLTGDAVEGRIVQILDEAEGRGHAPVWIVESPADRPIRLREGSKVAPMRQPKRVGRVLSICLAGGVRRLEVCITGGKTRRSIPDAPPAHDTALEGTTVRLLPASGGGLAGAKGFGVWNKDGCGAWLTHSAPQPAPAPAPASREDLVALVERLGGRS